MDNIKRLIREIPDTIFYTVLILASMIAMITLYVYIENDKLSKLASISTIIALVFVLLSFIKNIIYKQQEKDESSSIMARDLLRYIKENKNKIFLERIEGKEEIVTIKSSIEGSGIKKAEEHLIKINEKIELLLIKTNSIKLKKKYTPYLDFYQTALLLANTNHSLITTDEIQTLNIKIHKEIGKEYYKKMRMIKLHIQNDNNGSNISVYRLLAKNLELDSSLIKYKSD